LRAILTNFGTTGDVQPLLALAVEMAAAGHHPVLAASPYFRPWVERHGVEFTPLGPDLRQLQRDFNTAMAEGVNTFERLQELFGTLTAVLPRMFEELRDACRGAHVLVSGPVLPAARMVHETTGIPFVSVQVANFGGGGTAPFQQASAAVINPFRESLGLPPLRDPLTVDANSPQLALFATSRHVLPPPLDWPAHYHMTGYFFLEEKSWRPDPALESFIAEGEPPVVVTFGSTTYGDPGAVADKVLQAVGRVGCRAVIQQGWSGLGSGRPLPPGVFLAGVVPHEYLFPRAGCIVHHGGAGTAASAFLSGVPSVFVTHAGGQPLRAQLAQELGCAGPPVPYLELTADRLADAVEETLRDPRLREAARRLGALVAREQGVQGARQLIERLVHSIGLCEEGTGVSADPGAPERARARDERLLARQRFIRRQRDAK
jgi:sterol 3beta-glucosyltransferase